MNPKRQVLIATRITQSFVDWLEAKGLELVYFEDMDAHDFNVFEGIITSNRLFLPQKVLTLFSQLKWIGRMGSGMEIIDTNHTDQHEIVVRSSPDGNANAVAEQALGTLLSMFHNIHSSAMEVKSGVWQREINRGYEIEKRRIGIVGLGNNGSLFAKKAALMDMEVCFYDPYLPNDFKVDYAERMESYEALIASDIDVLSFHVPQNEETYHYFKIPDLALLKQPIYLLNIARGALVDWDAIYKGWQQEKIIKAGLDVLENEPLSTVPENQRKEMQEMIDQGDLLLTPHIGGYTFEAIDKMGESLMRQLDCHVLKS